jgi:hypothetical protein
MSAELEFMRFMGIFPDKINPKQEPKMWKCSKCGYRLPKPVMFSKIPSPCKCGSIFWETEERGGE